MPATPRRFVVCLDGTWNKVESRTNVVRFFECLAQDEGQKAYYDEGVGVPRPEDPWWWRLRDQLNGGVFGSGLIDNVMKAWRWLAEHFEPARGDTVALVGFSRGAYTARVLAGLLVNPGLPVTPFSADPDCKRTARLAREVSDYRAREKKGPPPAGCTPIDVAFLGVWDTVGSLGVPKWNLWPLVSVHSIRFIDTFLPPRILVARHAVAIDEHREDYAPVLWTPSGATGETGRDVQQVWFAGCHAQIGGGYLEDMLSEIPLAWMCEEAAKTGVRFRGDALDAPSGARIPARLRLDGREYLTPIIDSWRSFLRGSYRWLSPRNIRQIQVVGLNESVHPTVWDKWANDPDYRPPNIAHLGRSDVGVRPEVTPIPLAGGNTP